MNSFVVAHVDGIKPCGEYAVVTFRISRTYWIGMNHAYKVKTRCIVWDMKGECMATVPGITFPVNPADPTFVTWLTSKKGIGESLFTQINKDGTQFYPSRYWEGELPDPMLPELAVGPNYITYDFSQEFLDPDYPDIPTSETGTIDIVMSSGSPVIHPGAYYVAPRSALLQSNIEDTPVIYSAFHTSVTSTYHYHMIAPENWGFVDLNSYTVNSTVHSPFGVLESYSEVFDFSYGHPGGNHANYSGIWPMQINPQPQTYWYKPDAIWERLFIDNGYAGTMSDRSIVSIFFHQNRTLDFTGGVGDLQSPSSFVYQITWPALHMYDCPPLTITYGGKTFNVHAQAVTPPGGTDGTDYVALGRTSAFEFAITAAVADLYDGFDGEAESMFHIGISTNIVR